MYTKIPRFQLDTRPGSMCWSPVSQGVVSCVWLCIYIETSEVSGAPLPVETHQLFGSLSSLGQSSSLSSAQDRFRTLIMGWIQDVVCVTWLMKYLIPSAV